MGWNYADIERMVTENSPSQDELIWHVSNNSPMHPKCLCVIWFFFLISGEGGVLYAIIFINTRTISRFRNKNK